MNAQYTTAHKAAGLASGAAAPFAFHGSAISRVLSPMPCGRLPSPPPPTTHQEHPLSLPLSPTPSAHPKALTLAELRQGRDLAPGPGQELREPLAAERHQRRHLPRRSRSVENMADKRMENHGNKSLESEAICKRATGAVSDRTSTPPPPSTLPPAASTYLSQARVIRSTRSRYEACPLQD
eukprot:CAMPEP_0113715244 /NCGR_PEP_ID=MMETSP0038_2-20120614/33151_1 /TAXON_ID=2898 /ORGANISM="Cryptomonas paramecium" /LENGTH=180 /DNA_ID=CAMNT_0000642483 /DNA_START=545 /DNA_END=1088 /DNA_ORIENTATION=+ /assembly_acc=CAM_ASM_000170